MGQTSSSYALYVGGDPEGTRLAYEVAGEGPALVLVHGRALDLRMWGPQLDAFAARHTSLSCSEVRSSGATEIACVAAVGFLMLTGRMDWRRGLTVVVGCFVIFGAVSIVAGIRSLAGGLH